MKTNLRFLVFLLLVGDAVMRAQTYTWTTLAGLALAAILMNAGCTTGGTMLGPPSDEVRQQLGRVNVTVGSPADPLRLALPPSKREAAGEAATRVGFFWLGNGDNYRGGGEGAIFGLAWAPVGLVLGGAYGAIAGMTETKALDAYSTLVRAARSLRLEVELRDGIVAEIERKTPVIVVPLRPVSGLESGQPDLSPAGREDGAILEIVLFAPTLGDQSSVTASVALTVHVRVRLLNRERQELYYDYLEYRGPAHRFAHWAENDARLLREEVGRCVRVLSDEIVCQLFRRAPGERADTAQLAAQVLTRRQTTRR